MTFSRLVRVAALVAVSAAGAAFAQGAAGVSDERVTLPGAPGSLDGLGSNAIASGNQGALSYQVAFEPIPGFPHLTPKVNLSYSSNGGSTIVGIGWSIPTFSIERRTVAGLQKYAPDDTFVVDGSEQLLRVAQDMTNGTATYRSRFEGGFTRYTWKAIGTGENGYWTAEMPDGRIAYYGADRTGTAVPTAQVIVPGSSPSKVFRWHMVSIIDPYGHEMHMTWTKNANGYPLLDRADYVFDGATPRHSMRFTYEVRNDLVSDARPGFELLLDQRLKQVTVVSGTEVVRAYTLTYEADAASGGQSRLQSVSRFGRNNVQFPVTFNFAYNQTLGATCTTGSCDKPFVSSMGTLGGVDFSTGKATLVDINGDALPDVLYSDSSGHHFYYAKLDSEGHASFASTPFNSTKVTTATAFVLGDPKTQLLDLNGDGFVDLAQAATESVLCNKGTGDWVDASQCTGATINLPASAMADDADATQADPHNVRFFDYDNDRRIDWLRTFSMAAGTEVLANTVSSGFTSVAVDNIGATFDEDPLELADMNGDGLQDPVEIIVAGSAVQARYRLNYGYGKWGPWKTITLSGLDTTQASLAQVDDINGDGLSDIVAVTSTDVRIALNRNGERFDPIRVLTTADLASGSTLPTRVTGTTVLFADMNGNGSDDIVWIQQNGAVSYLELFPVRPNLLTRIDNSVGGVQVIAYGSSITEQARDATGMPWPNKLPHAATLVKTMTSFVTLTGTATSGLREIDTYDYHAGFYDGVEKQFRGYEGVTHKLVADMAVDAQEPGVIESQFDVGKTDPTLAGQMLKSQTFSTATGSPVLLEEDRSLWAVCDVAQAVPESKFACERAHTTIHVERDAASAITTRTEKDYDGYGHVIAERELGVVNLGTPEAPTACSACIASGVFGAPCGMTCDGDEQYTTSEYVVPGTDTSGKWLIGLVKHTNTSAVSGMPGIETQTFYDGPDFVGLPSGQATVGTVTRVMHRSGPGMNDFLPAERAKHDAHGNAIEVIDPLSATDGTGGGRRLYTYDSTGLNILHVDEILTTTGTGVTALRTDYAWDTAWEEVSQVSNLYPIVGGMPAATPQVTSNRFDDHGRLLRRLEPGETDATASMEIVYQLADPASSVLIKERSSPTSGQDLETVRCFDGKGRMFQTRNKLSDTQWQVSGFTEFDARGQTVRRYLPYLGSSEACEMAPPSGGLFTTFKFDVLERPLSEVESDGSTKRAVYTPLARQDWDENDTDMMASFPSTPNITVTDGLSRPVAMKRLSQPIGTGTPAVTTVEYDVAGHISAVRDPLGNLHAQSLDPMGRLVSVTEPNLGTEHITWDDNSNPVKRTDANNKVTHTDFDSINRPIARWDEADMAGTKETWTYDLLTGCSECTNGGGHIVEETWSGPLAGSLRSGYEQKGKLIYSERKVGSASLVTRYRFDEKDRPISVTWPGGLNVDVTYDGDDRITKVSGVIDGVTYDGRGDVQTIKHTNGVSTDYTRDARRRITGIKVSQGGNALLDLGYTWNPHGDLLALTDGTRAGRARHSGTFTYDAYRRLTQASLGREGGADEVLTFAYDELDNITSKTSSLGAQSPAHVGDYTYDTTHKNAATKAGDVTYTYDAAGQMVGRGDSTFTRDSQGRLVGAASGGTARGTYAYANVDRVAKQEDGWTTLYLGPDVEVRDGILSAYVRLGHDRIARMQSDATAAQLYSDLAPATGSGGQLSVTGDGTIDIADTWLAQASSLGTVHLSGGPTPSAVDDLLRSSARRLLMTDVIWLHHDAIGSAVLATTADGAVRGEQSFYPTGETRTSFGYVDAYGFTGDEIDAATGLVHFRRRELDTHSGRWDRPDPAFAELTGSSVANFGEATVGYAYVRNTFMNANDPTGLGAKEGPRGASLTRQKNAKGKGALAKAKGFGKTTGQKIKAGAGQLASKGKTWLKSEHDMPKKYGIEILLSVVQLALSAASAYEAHAGGGNLDLSRNLSYAATGVGLLANGRQYFNTGKKVYQKLTGKAPRTAAPRSLSMSRSGGSSGSAASATGGADHRESSHSDAEARADSVAEEAGSNGMLSNRQESQIQPLPAHALAPESTTSTSPSAPAAN